MPVTNIALKQFKLLHNLPNDIIAELSQHAQLIDLPRRKVVMQKNRAAHSLGLLLSGRLQGVDMTLDGKEAGLYFIEPNDFFGELSVIDFKTANKQREEGWIDNYFMQTTAYAHMYEETFGTPIEQIVILLASEDGTSQCFIKEKKDYEQDLMKAIDGFYKYYEELNKDKISK